jgi:hypothetical protein
MKKSLKSHAKKVLRGGTAATGAVSLATLGLTTCSDNGGGGGVVDPAPPPPLTCKEGNHGQNLDAFGSLPGPSPATLRVDLADFYHSQVGIDTLYVTDTTGAVFDSLNTDIYHEYLGGRIRLYFTLDSLSVTEVKFTLKGTWKLKAGSCNFQRLFTCTIKQNGSVTVTQRELRLPLDVPRDVRIELVDRDGLRVNLRAAMVGEGVPEWRATAGKLERMGRLGVTWELPSEPGYYQVELSVDRGVHGIGFDALAMEVS